MNSKLTSKVKDLESDNKISLEIICDLKQKLKNVEDELVAVKQQKNASNNNRENSKRDNNKREVLDDSLENEENDSRMTLRDLSGRNNIQEDLPLTRSQSLRLKRKAEVLTKKRHSMSLPTHAEVDTPEKDADEEGCSNKSYR